ncbi:pyridoxamine 5'-phosphate oxidase [Flavobacterium akiainvivens]|uniref:Pyridoxine/pyridoxamine 5'-phosphate oxidase n=1 Tax=Flavobacterium akiainvivens TaxID=1202724 RepID=A0A0M8MG27_9FLAO|nr:pyridoxamine 5'-phosphate oxidase [Flavobacterium akiainvivens]KOS05017.1 pyridoxamine 5'-phosphate oxidase [Flavobacterium akiainvivens]SFQ40266.1 Pyridoxamine 5'-phosphate oxidase [Flavobacterium akiainvivens]
MTDLSNYRKVYDKSILTEEHLPEDPITLFKNWFIEFEESGSAGEVNAMTVSTFGLDGFPKNRVVLLKQFTFEGFTFYTNYDSEKGRAIAANPNVCLSFFWQEMERQVIIKGVAEKTSANNSDGYFESRPHGSQLGAKVSPQSEVIPSRDFLEDALKALEAEYEGKEVPRPDNWGGYLVRPVEVEFWQGRPNRLHDRIRYTQQQDLGWKTERLAP